jgi:hypothetical protein
MTIEPVWRGSGSVDPIRRRGGDMRRAPALVTVVPAVLLAAAVHADGAFDARPKEVPPCRDFEARLLVGAREARRGSRPDFTLSIRNTSGASLRLLDTRRGRRSDLGNAYYRLVVLTRGGGEAGITSVISDPGPIEEGDFFVMAPGDSTDIGITTPLALETLRPGGYDAHVVVMVDPYRVDSRCRSEPVAFRVR